MSVVLGFILQGFRGSRPRRGLKVEGLGGLGLFG